MRPLSRLALLPAGVNSGVWSKPLVVDSEVAVREFVFHGGDSIGRQRCRVKLNVPQTVYAVDYRVEKRDVAIVEFRANESNAIVVVKPKRIPRPSVFGENGFAAFLSIGVNTCRPKPRDLQEEVSSNGKRHKDDDGKRRENGSATINHRASSVG